MGKIMRFLRPLIDNFRDQVELENLRRQRMKLDRRIKTLEKLTLNGEDEWFVKIVKRDPSCAFKVINECGDRENDRH
jgi:hypothetical protein